MPTVLPGTPIAEAIAEAPSAHATYVALLATDTLAFQACAACSSAVFPPRQRCPHCGADALSWRRSLGEGTVYATTVIQPRDRPAYSVVLVDLDEGVRMMSRIVEAAAEDIAIGDRVEIRFQHTDDEVLPLFAPAAGGDR